MTFLLQCGLKNIKLVNKKNDYRVGLLADDVQKMILQNFAVAGATTLPVLYFNNVQALSLQKIEIPGNKHKTIEIK